MEIPRNVRRKRAIQATAILLALYLLPVLAAKFFPTITGFVPPFLVSILIVFGIFDALLLWRKVWLLDWLFPREEGWADVSSCTARRDSVVAIVGLVVSISIVGLWVRSLC